LTALTGLCVAIANAKTKANRKTSIERINTERLGWNSQLVECGFGFLIAHDGGLIGFSHFWAMNYSGVVNGDLGLERVDCHGATLAQTEIIEKGLGDKMNLGILAVSVERQGELNTVAIPARLSIRLVRVVDNLDRLVDRVCVPSPCVSAGLVMDTVPYATVVHVELAQGAATVAKCVVGGSTLAGRIKRDHRADAVAAHVRIEGVERQLGKDIAGAKLDPVGEVAIDDNSHTLGPTSGSKLCGPDGMFRVPRAFVTLVGDAEVGLFPRPESLDRLPCANGAPPRSHLRSGCTAAIERGCPWRRYATRGARDALDCSGLGLKGIRRAWHAGRGRVCVVVISSRIARPAVFEYR
jgi:hypothetical protein